MQKHLVLVGALIASTLVLGPGASLRAQDSPTDPSAETADKAGKGEKKGGKQTVEERVATMTADLGLDDEQQAKLTEILKTEEDALKELRADKELEKEARGAKMKEIRATTKTAIEEILTPEQKEKFSPKKGGAKGDKAGKGKKDKAADEDGSGSED